MISSHIDFLPLGKALNVYNIFFSFFQGQEGLQGSPGEVGLPGEKVRRVELVSIIVGDNNQLVSYVWLVAFPKPCVCISQGEQGLPGSVGLLGFMGVEVCCLQKH